MKHSVFKPSRRYIWSALAVFASLFALSAVGCGKKDSDAKSSVDSSKPPPDMEALRQRSGAPPAKTGNGQ